MLLGLSKIQMESQNRQLFYWKRLYFLIRNYVFSIMYSVFVDTLNCRMVNETYSLKPEKGVETIKRLI